MQPTSENPSSPSTVEPKILPLSTNTCGRSPAAMSKPKDRHAKRRLTSKEFFKRYDNILKKDGVVEFKTDNNDLFDFSLEQIPEAGWNIVEYTRDLHNNEKMNEGNIMTEYEERFSKMGNNINKLIANR